MVARHNGPWVVEKRLFLYFFFSSPWFRDLALLLDWRHDGEWGTMWLVSCWSSHGRRGRGGVVSATAFCEIFVEYHLSIVDAPCSCDQNTRSPSLS